MAKAGINQGELAKILGASESEVSVVLNKYDLSKAETDIIITKIRDAEPDTA